MPALLQKGLSVAKKTLGHAPDLLRDFTAAERAEDSKAVLGIRQFADSVARGKPYDGSDLQACSQHLRTLDLSLEDFLHPGVDVVRDYIAEGGAECEKKIEAEINDLQERESALRIKFGKLDEELKAVITDLKVISGGRGQCVASFTVGCYGRRSLLQTQLRTWRTFIRKNAFWFHPDLAFAATYKTKPVSLSQASNEQNHVVLSSHFMIENLPE